MNKLSYAFGVSLGHHLLENGVKELQMEDFCQGVKDALGNSVTMSVEEINKVLGDYFDEAQKEMDKRHKEESEKAKKDGIDFLEKNSTADGVQVTESGLQYKVIKKSENPDGKSPNKNSVVKCHYEGKLIDGTVFDSSWKRGNPTSFGLSMVIPGWTEGLQLMKEGDTFEFYIPYQLGYNENGIPGTIPGYSTLIFKVELLEVK